MVSRHCVSANHQQGSELKLERLTICMVSDEEMAKVLSQPGYSHLNGSTCQFYRCQSNLLSWACLRLCAAKGAASEKA